jgi:putative ABC transport system ATP-binding protein
MTAATLLEAKAIVKELGQGAGKVRALKGVDLALKGGELTLLMGPSGSGKTTLLSILGCILSPTEGEVVIGGRSTKGLKPEGLARLRRDQVGFVFQDYNLFPTLTATENIKLALDVRGMAKAEQRTAAEAALVSVGLADKINSYPGQMSGGQQQRVAIARALAGKPSVILADEPTAALDSENGQAIMALLSEIARDETRAVLAVTHDPRTLSYADRIVHIEDGLIVREERPEKRAKAKAETGGAPPTATASQSHAPVEASVTQAAAPAIADPPVSAEPNGTPAAMAAPAEAATPPRPTQPAGSHVPSKTGNRRKRSHRFARGEYLP